MEIMSNDTNDGSEQPLCRSISMMSLNWKYPWISEYKPVDGTIFTTEPESKADYRLLQEDGMILAICRGEVVSRQGVLLMEMQQRRSGKNGIYY
ncbi:unnamed protein product [Nezara viridula]|uniref:Uncharacterized protein n=1 Tax=Nezara viridula TaxID=85310 RepID=A0A9P0EF73_NEZVI|nr:unnamed protein product [Nezara viridula]